MAVFTELTFDEVAAFFRVLGLDAPRSVRGITSGIENTNYFVDTDGARYVLTLFERLTSEQLPYYLHFIKHLPARGMPVPHVVAVMPLTASLPGFCGVTPTGEQKPPSALALSSSTAS